MDDPARNNMEKSFLDEMYGDLGSKTCDSPAIYDEDSVDIYSGLDRSPGNSKNADSVATPILCQKLKDSMDLYEEIITEEEQQREATHNELKGRLDMAENKVKELIWKLQQVQTQNKTLLNENMQLKKNISAVIKTAKMEIGRKDEEICRLNHRSARFGCTPPFSRSQVNYQRRELTRPNPAGTCDPAGSIQTQEHRVGSARQDLPPPSQKDRHGLVQRPGAEPVDALPLNSSLLEKARDVGTAIEASSKHADVVHVNNSRDPRILPTGKKGQTPSERQCARNDDRLQVTTVTQGLAVQERTDGKRQSTGKRDQRSCDESGVSNECKVKDRGGLHTELQEVGQDHAKQGKGSRLHTAEIPRRCERVHSPPRQKRPSPTADASHHRPANTHASKGRRRDPKDTEATSIQERRRNHDPNGLGAEPSGKERRQHSSSQGGAEERSGSSSRRRAERSPPREQRRREDEGGGSRRERSSRTERSKDHERSKRKESDRGQRDGSRKKDAESGSRESLRNGKQAAPSSAPCCKTESSGDQAKCPASGGQRDQAKNGRDSKVPGGKPGGEKDVDRNSQNKKLSFMETLNLTLSPVKKPRLSPEGDQENRPAEAGQEECDQFHLGEDYCVIDEVHGSHEPFLEKVVPAPVSPVGEEAPQSAHKSDLEELEKTAGRHGDKIQLPEQVISESEEPSHCENNAGLRGAEGEPPAVSDNQLSGSSPSEESPSKEERPVSGRKDTDPDRVTFLRESQDISPEKHADASIHHHVLAPADARLASLSPSNDETCQPICGTPPAESESTVARDPDGIDMNTSPEREIGDHTKLQNSPVPAQSDRASELVLGPVETNPDCAVSIEKDDVSTDVVSSTVNMPPDTCMADVIPNVTEVVIISSTEPESDVKNSAGQHILSEDHALELPGANRMLTMPVVPEQEVSSSSPSPKTCPEPNSTGNEDQDPVPSSSNSFHDEDSMMLTLKSIQFFPNAISPLTSPVRPVKNQALSTGKAPHVKSLNKEFSSVTVSCSTSVRRMDVNKENEKPACSSVQSPQEDQAPPAVSSRSSPSSAEDENELEEGEIVSDGEDASPAIASPPQDKASSVMANNNRSSSRSPRLAKKGAQKTPEVSAGVSRVGGKAMSSKSKKRSLSTKKPFKTTVPLLPKTNPSTIPEVMDMLKQIRAHKRNKYMKLPKSFPKKSFYGIIEMSRVSFTEFVNNVNFSKLCSMEHNLKPKLNNIISVCMNKIANNGIVKRIFEQQSPSLKKKLWNFVEGQFDYLFGKIKATLLSLCTPTDVKRPSMTKNSFEKPKKKLVPVLKKLPDSAIKSWVASVPNRTLEQTKTLDRPGTKAVLPRVIPHRTGLGSRGKNLRMTASEQDKVPGMKKQDLPPVHQSAAIPSNNASSPEKPPALVRRLSHSASLQDKSDFEILTEQQTSSLTFNLVRDSQMGEIFKCLLQGTDLLENSVCVADSSDWSVSTPRKEATCGESFAGMITPNKAATPSKLITDWSDISPCRLSPNSKIRIPLNPAVLDESCMLEVPPSLPFDRATQSSTVISERSYSILTEDLAVSLTIPSPLKSDSHLSFLNAVNREPASAPDSVISARISEDALLDGEDATEQDIHLTLDSDNTSESSGGGVSEEATTSPVFQFKPHVPMQAVVMERSNDHFIVKIRHASTNFMSSTSHNPVDTDEPQSVLAGGRKAAMDTVLPTSESASVSEECRTLASRNLADVQLPNKNVTCGADGEPSHGGAAREPAGYEAQPEGAHAEPAVNSDGSFHPKNKDRTGKRKKQHPEQKAKKAKTDREPGGIHKQEQKSRNVSKAMRSPMGKSGGSVSTPLSPNSLSAKNVVRKGGEVVVTWTREEDRDILIELKTKGASPETFSALSTKINKSPSQIAERFSQLMKLFKKKEKMKV